MNLSFLLALGLAIAPAFTASASTTTWLCNARLPDGSVRSSLISASNELEAMDRFIRILDQLELGGEINADGTSIDCSPA